MVEVENAAPRRRRRFRPAALLACAAAAAIAAAAPAAPAAPAAERVKHVYDVRDLLTVVPDFDDGVSLGLQGFGRAPAPAKAFVPDKPEVRAKAFADWLAGAIGRPDADAPTVAVLDGQLVVTADVAAQVVAGELLERVRADRRAQVTLELRHVAFDGDLTGVKDAAVRGQLALAMAPDAPAVELDDVQVNRLLAAAQADAKSVIVTAPRMTLFNRQRAYVLVARQTAFVMAHDEAKGADGKLAFTPRVETVESGVLFDARATLDAGHKSVAVDVRYEHARVLGMKDAKQRASDGTELPIQMPATSETRFRRVLTIPSGRTAVVYVGRGRPVPADVKPPPGKLADAELVGDAFVLVKATVVHGAAAAAEARQFPLLNTKTGE